MLCLVSLFVGIFLDAFLFEKETAWGGYIPFIILAGVVFQHIPLLLIISILLGVILSIDAAGSFLPSLFLSRTIPFFLLSFVVSFVVKSVYHKRESLLIFTSTLSRFLDARDPYTAFHSNNVAYYCCKIGEAMKLSEDDCLHLYIGGILHDIGKIGVPESILNKPAQLTDEEYEIIKNHVQVGYDILKNVPCFHESDILDMVLHHHEKFDGTGYPHQLKGDEIPKLSRIIAVADSFDAMTSKRIYQKDLDLAYAIQQLNEGKGTQFDPEVVDVFLSLLRNGIIQIQGKEKAKEKKKNQPTFISI